MPFNFLAFFIQILIGFALQVVGYLLTSQPKQEKTSDVQDLDSPTAEAGRPIPVLFGELEIQGLNCVWYGQKSTNTYDVEI